MNRSYSSLILISLMLFSSCSRSNPNSSAPQPAHTPSLTGEDIDPASVAPGQSRSVHLSNGAEIEVENLGGHLVYEAEGTFSADSFSEIQSNLASKPAAEKTQALQAEIERVLKQLSSRGAVAVRAVPSMGYFKFLLPYQPSLFSAIQDLSFDRSIIVGPVLVQSHVIHDIKKLSSEINQALGPRVNTGSGTSAFSGLQMIHAVDFVKRAEQDIGGGAQVDGSSVRVGVGDTGITYNHPTFLSSDGKTNRIQLIKDTTGEGAVYINSSAAFSAAPGSTDDTLIVNAQIIPTLKLPVTPLADQFKEIKNLEIKVTPELKKILLDPNSGAKLGILDESLLQGGEVGAVDLNGNGKTDDLFYLIYIPAGGDQPERVYFDSSATGDFRSSPSLQDFNLSHQTMPIFAERIGFSFSETHLTSQSASSAPVAVKEISFVGFDSGDHGTHVSGIIAGRKTIANDSDSTLARGVAPEARIYFEKVCSNAMGCSANEALADLADKVDVINLSIGGLTPFNDGSGVQETLVNRLVSAKNAAVIISAGNEGPGRQTVGSPGTARLSLCIGAAASREMISRQFQWPGYDPSGDSDFELFFSSRGPTAGGGFKPNLSAPGTELSSLPLNVAPGSLGGLNVMWGTSMAAPTVTGGYALLLDAIRKYNAAHPSTPLASDAMTLRRVLIESARPFDLGELTWIDEGAGMLDLTAAWDKLFALRDQNPPSSVTLDGKSVELDYEIISASKTQPNEIPFDGTVKNANGAPAFANGLYLTADEQATYKGVYIERELPEGLRASKDAGDLVRQLETTQDEFVLKTTFYGAGQDWLKPGVQQINADSMQCANAQTGNLTLLGQGSAVATDPATGQGTINENIASVLLICLDHEKIKTLAPGDHGALIYGYRTANGKTSPVASFIIPVTMNVPDKTLKNSAKYLITDTVKSFQVKRHTIEVPKGTSVMRITLSVPTYNGTCSGPELMLTRGLNTDAPYTNDKDPRPARVSNCSNTGVPSPDKNPKVVFTEPNPRPGLWELHVFGQYTFASSEYTLQVDYVTGEMSRKMISGDPSVLSGQVQWKLADSSFDVTPDTQHSLFNLSDLVNSTPSKVDMGATVYVKSPLGVLRTYPAEVKSVTIGTGQSPGNDIDLTVLECPASATTADDPKCTTKGISNGPTDEESVKFTPIAGMRYAVRVDGSTVKDGGNFVSTEDLEYEAEPGLLSIVGADSVFTVSYSFPVASSALLKNPFFTSGDYKAAGALSLRMSDDTVLSAIPVEIRPQ